jgi:hypothetical protein
VKYLETDPDIPLRIEAKAMRERLATTAAGASSPR